ncbi:uncharacterized protein LOC127853246 isoform X1 [Dreissena polymorpha]|uniref:uncharacterized protein LOC127853246 isoform X1 n=2 Tax=Dreissena polymorpha TaxID=45954 RepID=UPI002263E2A8|nr:uncharacterized protein LOC127853246 isoform X1 [Dreissena polymorpha]
MDAGQRGRSADGCIREKAAWRENEIHTGAQQQSLLISSLNNRRFLSRLILHGSVFFIYDHNVLKKEEDDLKDAIIYFSPEEVPENDQCMLCGQLMGMSEFLCTNISKSAPRVFKFEKEKFAIKKTASYSLVLQGSSFVPDINLLSRLDALYDAFVTFHGSIDSLKLRWKGNQVEYLTELAGIWRILLRVTHATQGYSLAQTFQSIPYTQLPLSGSHLFLQASHLLQSSQRRPYVLSGAILYKNSVLCSQLPPRLTKNLMLLQEQMPHISMDICCELPKGCTVMTAFLTAEELSDISPFDLVSKRHCKLTDFQKHRETRPSDEQSRLDISAYKAHKGASLQRRLTFPNVSSTNLNTNSANKSHTVLQSFLSNQKKKAFYDRQQIGLKSTWSQTKGKNISTLLSDVPIVECQNGESGIESESDMYEGVTGHHFGEKYVMVSHTDTDEHESESESEDLLDSIGITKSVENGQSESEEVLESTKNSSNRISVEVETLEKDEGNPSVSDLKKNDENQRIFAEQNKAKNDEKKSESFENKELLSQESFGERLTLAQLDAVNSTDFGSVVMQSQSSEDYRGPLLYDDLSSESTFHTSETTSMSNAESETDLKLSSKTDIHEIKISAISKIDQNREHTFNISEKESQDSNYPKRRHWSSESNKYESEVETEDDAFTISNIEPCISCYDLGENAGVTDSLSLVRCQKCIDVFNKQVKFGVPSENQEILEFDGKFRERNESSTETESHSDKDQKPENFIPAAAAPDSVISRYWTHEMEGMNDVTVYVQCHADISLVLLMANPDLHQALPQQENLFYSLWKASLAHLADLDFYIKECMENEAGHESDPNSKDLYNFLQFDKYSAELQGTTSDPMAGNVRVHNQHQMLADLHAAFQADKCLSDITIRSHITSCYGQSNEASETFFHPSTSQKLVSGLPVPRESILNMDVVARQRLDKDKNVAIL